MSKNNQYRIIVENLTSPSHPMKKNTAKLYGDALVWTTALIDQFELIYELIGLTVYLTEWLNDFVGYYIRSQIYLTVEDYVRY